MSARYFFHLCNGKEVIPDEVGVEVSGLDYVGDAFVQTIREMLRKQELSTSELDGWQVRVIDTTGNVAATFGLGDLKDLGC